GGNVGVSCRGRCGPQEVRGHLREGEWYMVKAASESPTSGAHGKAIGVSIAAAVGGFLFGFDSSAINGAVDSISSHFELNPFLTGFIVSVALLGCAVGAWYAGRLADRWGRRRVM